MQATADRSADGRRSATGADYGQPAGDDPAGPRDRRISRSPGYIRKAASQVEGVADTIRTGNSIDLLQGAQITCATARLFLGWRFSPLGPVRF